MGVKESSSAALLKKQRAFFVTDQTKSVNFRLQQLKKLRKIIKANEEEITSALASDLGKHPLESYATEIGLVLREIRVTEKKLASWVKDKRVSTPFFLWPSTSKVSYEPLGNVLIIGPFNYPFQLLLMPLIGAIAAGNTAVIKPSELTPKTAQLIKRMIAATFNEEYLAVVEGGKEINQELLSESFDYIFFTGSKKVGKIVLQQAAAHLTPVTLELGGKSPAFVTKNSDLKLAAKRIIYGKMINAGQTCVAPDYVLVDATKQTDFIKECVKVIEKFYGKSPQNSDDYARIVNSRHFQRLADLLEKSTTEIIHGGHKKASNLYIEPTLLKANWQSATMTDEIFGPLLPIISYCDLSQVLEIVKKQSKPLATYIFSTDKKEQKEILTKISSGGVSINHTIFQLASDKLPFGGVGQSGMGNYHGKASFLTFSHQKSVLTAKRIDTPFIFPPYQKSHLKWLRKILK